MAEEIALRISYEAGKISGIHRMPVENEIKEEDMSMTKKFCFDDVPVLETTGGKLKGYFYNGAYIFKGVPYAYADRFEQPREAKWDGIKEAMSYGFVCPLMERDNPCAELMVPHRYWPQDEHCQNLNQKSGRRKEDACHCLAARRWICCGVFDRADGVRRFQSVHGRGCSLSVCESSSEHSRVS